VCLYLQLLQLLLLLLLMLLVQLQQLTCFAEMMMQLRRLLSDGAVMLRMSWQRVNLSSGACHCSGDVCVPDVDNVF
jgi:hypothetical protein